MSETLPLSILNNRRMSKWVSFQPDRTVKLAVGKVEIGQGKANSSREAIETSSSTIG